ncbi:LysR family transcriptional regulator [Denitrobaculum tricleocarpae]|uniref:LysR family transcriptional regulator n=1 Tax=Denitrobaculum tricleocarpae TaxID=2591009 RepID=A0A545TG64_9PROT|nr:LysR family transcriptional regulator [Denitrobaculum tricleocarpae]TQV76217.1 LysR family transcriptional regulator [Denitrobaculum tricleocarpae]
MSLLENIRVFVRVVELGSLSAAGRHMRVSPAVASHRMKELEKHVGVRLFNRTTRQLSPTEHGRLFYEGCLEVLHALEQAEATVAAVGGRPRGAIRVTVPLGLGRRVIGPAIPDFCALYPEIEVRLRLSDYVIDLAREGVEVAIRLAVLGDSSLTMRKICDCERVLCAAPGYLEAQGIPRTPEELLKHRCLLLRYPGSTQFRWPLQTKDGPAKLSISGPFESDDGDILTDWALAGQGIVMKPLFEVAEHLRSGALLPVLTETPPEPVSLAILYPHRRLLAPKIKAFADFMHERCLDDLGKTLQGLSLAELQDTAAL